MMMGMDVSCYTQYYYFCGIHPKHWALGPAVLEHHWMGWVVGCQEKRLWIGPQKGLIQVFYVKPGRLLGESRCCCLAHPPCSHIFTPTARLWLLEARRYGSTQVSRSWAQVLPLRSMDHGILDSCNGHWAEILRGRNWGRWEPSKVGV